MRGLTLAIFGVAIEGLEGEENWTEPRKEAFTRKREVSMPNVKGGGGGEGCLLGWWKVSGVFLMDGCLSYANMRGIYGRKNS
jgi:hypothetical protein